MESAKIGGFLRRRLTDSQKTWIKGALFHPFFRRILGKGLSLRRSDLSTLAVCFGSDKEGDHFYTQHYERHFAAWRQKSLNVLEIGIGGYDDPKLGGASLRMWKAYFPKSRIFGIDIFDKSYHDEDRIKTFKGSQVDEAFLRKVAGEIGPLHIIIDDGSHLSAHVIQTFKILFPLLEQGGIYAVEDLQTSYWGKVDGEDWGGSCDPAASHTSMNFLKSLVDGLNYEEFPTDNYSPSYFDRHVVAMHFYHNLAFVYKGVNNERSRRFGKRDR